MTKIAKEHFRIFRSDGKSLHLIRQAEANYCPYVVCWNLRCSETEPHMGCWDWGAYCKTLEEALEVFNCRCQEHAFKLTA